MASCGLDKTPGKPRPLPQPLCATADHARAFAEMCLALRGARGARQAARVAAGPVTETKGFPNTARRRVRTSNSAGHSEPDGGSLVAAARGRVTERRGGGRRRTAARKFPKVSLLQGAALRGT